MKPAFITMFRPGTEGRPKIKKCKVKRKSETNRSLVGELGVAFGSRLSWWNLLRKKVKNYLQFTIQWLLGSLRSRRALAIGVTYSMAIGAIRPIDDRRRAWQAVVAVAVAVADVTALATGNGGKQAGRRRAEEWEGGGHWGHSATLALNKHINCWSWWRSPRFAFFPSLSPANTFFGCCVVVVLAVAV